ncbi:hypothetical protein [Priestia megaterium]|uniref:hypothetical protein n=1 Tax=Priestia megaterium TaxID=1404 RepID=UPI000BF69954|nr:hypothetical protein [Priestia megaterium]PFW43757.1 hypothetical protein COL17_26475 [Priestia megaterium]
MKLTIGQLEDLWREESLELENGTELSVVEEGEWVHDHKYQHAEVIFTDGEKFYSGYIGRSGSDFTYWSYDSEMHGKDSQADISEVVKATITKEIWKAV